jgi:hypothetical protein
VNLKLSFTEDQIGVLFIHVLNASIRRKVGMGDMNCVAKVTIGEAVEATSASPDTKDSPPHWKETFKIPLLKSTEVGVIQILATGIGGNKLVGETNIQLSDFIGDNQ